MLIDGRLVPCGATLQCDVAIIGSGPAGITLAQSLAAAGYFVKLIEAGGRRHTAADNDGLSGESTGEPFPLVTSRQRGFGGTSGHWTPETGLRIKPFDPIDFEDLPSRPNSAWPFDRSALDPYYERAHQTLGVPQDYSTEQWVSGQGKGALTGSASPPVGMFQFARNDVFVGRFDDLVNSPRVDVVLNSTVSTLSSKGDASSIDEASVVCPGGNRFQVKATVFVLATGGIDNARMLLASPGRLGNGIGNEHDNVGRYFHDHISIDCAELLDKNDRAFDVAHFDESTTATGLKRQAMLWVGEDVIRREGLLNAAFWLFDADRTYPSPGVSAVRALKASTRTRPVRDIGRNLRRAVAGAPDLLAYAAHRVRRSEKHRVVVLRIMAEQIPHRDSRITLSPETDALGVRRVSLDWKVTSEDFELIRRHRDLVVNMLAARDVKSIGGPFDPASRSTPVMSNYHHMGSTRMHVDPTLGVVDADSRVHSTNNLFVAGASVFPAGGYLNPTLTVIAMAIRLADAIQNHLPALRAR